MSINRKFQALSSAILQDAGEVLSRTVHKATGKNFDELDMPPPLGLVLKAHYKVAVHHIGQAMKDIRDTRAESAAQKQGAHAAEIIDPDGVHSGYTTYNTPE